MVTRHIRNFPLYLHNCDAIRDPQCIRIYKDTLRTLSAIGWRLKPEEFNGLDELGKRARMEALTRYLAHEGVAGGAGEEMTGR